MFYFFVQDFSTDVNDWGAFGSYLGGVLGASISILALIGAVIAIYQQHAADRRVNNHTVASNLMISIERLEESIDSSLKKITIGIHDTKGDLNIDTDAFRILTGIVIPDTVITRVIPSYTDDAEAFVKNIMDVNLSDKDRYKKIELYEAFSTTCGRLRFMRDLLIQHKTLAGHNVSAIYYKRKYKLAVKRLRHAGYSIEAWDDVDEFKNPISARSP